MMSVSLFFFFNDTATTEIYTLSLHDALPICVALLVHADLLEHLPHDQLDVLVVDVDALGLVDLLHLAHEVRSEEHTSELQSRQYLVCRLLLEKKKKILIYSSSISQTHRHTVI